MPKPSNLIQTFQSPIHLTSFRILVWFDSFLSFDIDTSIDFNSLTFTLWIVYVNCKNKHFSYFSARVHVQHLVSLIPINIIYRNNFILAISSFLFFIIPFHEWTSNNNDRQKERDMQFKWKFMRTEYSVYVMSSNNADQNEMAKKFKFMPLYVIIFKKKIELLCRLNATSVSIFMQFPVLNISSNGKENFSIRHERIGN